MYSEKSCKNITEKNNSKACQAFRAALYTFQQRDFVKAEMHINAYKAYVDYNAFVKHDNRTLESPSASIIIVAYNTRQELIKCIKSILAGTRKDIEIIVVDNGGNEAVMPLLTSMPLLYIQTPMNFILSEGRNIGVNYAKGPVCIFLDDDAIAPSAYVEHTLAAFVTQEIIAVRGKIFPKTQGAFHGTYHHYDLGPKPLPCEINTEGNSAWRTDAYRVAGGMNPLLFGHEGTDLSRRLAVIYGENITFYWPVMHIFHDFAIDEATHIARQVRHRLMEGYLDWKQNTERSKQNPREVPMAAVKLFDKDFIDQLNACDFFAGDRESFTQLVEDSPVLAYGSHREPAPLVSIIITTYKRPQWLKLALDSALTQDGFDDYEVIIVDNEGERMDVETETSRLVRSYPEKKIVYYRNIPTVSQKTQTAVSLSRSKWFCILHDDDFLAKDHLKIMTGILKEHPHIGYLACPIQYFKTKDEAMCLRKSREDVGPWYAHIPFPAEAACSGCYPGWLGALINRDCYIDMGGMFANPPLSTGVNDLIMIFKYMNRYNNLHRAILEKPLYFYRISNAQASASGGTAWMNVYISEYIFYKYLSKKYHPILFPFWNYIAGIIIYEKIEGKMTCSKNWLGNTAIDIAVFKQLAGLPVRDIASVRFQREKYLLSCIRRYHIEGFKAQIVRAVRALICRIRHVWEKATVGHRE